MAAWPITTSEAASLLGIPKSTATTIVTACEIPSRRIGTAICLDEAAFEQLKAKAAPFQSRRRPRKPVAKKAGRRKAAAAT